MSALIKEEFTTITIIALCLTEVENDSEEENVLFIPTNQGDGKIKPSHQSYMSSL